MLKYVFVCSRRGYSPGRPCKRKHNNNVRRKGGKFASNISVNPLLDIVPFSPVIETATAKTIPAAYEVITAQSEYY